MSVEQRVVMVRRERSILVGIVAVACFVASLGCIVVEEGGSEEGDDDVSIRRGGGSAGSSNSAADPEGMEPEPEPEPEPVVEPDVFTLSGSIGEETRSGQALVLWYVTSGEEPYFYYHGGGEIAASGEWSVSVPLDRGALPEEAMNEDGVATAMVLGVTSWERADGGLWGRVSWDEFRELEGRTFAVSKESALVLLERGANPDARRAWAQEFVVGEVTCGAALLDGGSGAEPVSCARFKIEATRDLAWIRF